MRSKRRIALAVGVAALLLAAGCLSAMQPDDPRVGAMETVECPTHDDWPANATLEPRSIPERPAEVNASTADDYVADFERFYKWNQLVTPRHEEIILDLQYTTVQNETRTGYVVRGEVAFTRYVGEEDGGRSVGEGYYTAYYFVNESVVARATQAGDSRPGPDPSEGVVIDC